MALQQLTLTWREGNAELTNINCTSEMLAVGEHSQSFTAPTSEAVPAKSSPGMEAMGQFGMD